MPISDMYVGPLHAHDMVTFTKTIVYVEKWPTKVCFQLYSWNYHSLTHTHTHTHVTSFTEEHLLCKTTYVTLS
jgi:hypothetical protein